MKTRGTDGPRRKRWAAIPQELCDRVRVLRSCGHDQATVGELTDLHVTEVSKIEARGYVAATPGRKKRPVPPDFAFHVTKMTVAELCDHYRAGPSTIVKWRRAWEKNSGIKIPDRRGHWRKTDRVKRPVPPDFADKMDRENMAQLRARYRCANATIHGWAAAIGRPYRAKFRAWNKDQEGTENETQ